MTPPRAGRGVLALAAIVVLACSSGGGAGRMSASPARTPTPASPSPTAVPVVSSLPTPPPATVSTDLEFAGALAGRARGSPAAGTCGRIPSGFTVQVPFALGDQPLLLSIQVLDYGGPGTFSVPPERVSIRSPGGAPSPRFLPAVGGSVGVDAGERSGRIDATLAVDSGSATIRGTWSCAP